MAQLCRNSSLGSNLDVAQTGLVVCAEAYLVVYQISFYALLDAPQHDLISSTKCCWLTMTENKED